MFRFPLGSRQLDWGLRCLTLGKIRPITRRVWLTIFLAAEMVDWINESGGLGGQKIDAAIAVELFAGRKSAPSLNHLWPARERSPVVCTIDFEGVDADTISAVLRANGIVDTESYRKLGRNQLRIATFPVEPEDVEALCACIDYVVEELG